MYLVSSNKNLVLAGVLSVLVLVLAPAAARAGAKAPKAQEKPTISANELVRQAVQTEVGSPRQNQRVMYRMRKESPEKVETKEYVETDEGTVGRLLSINDQPLPPQIQANEEHRLQMLLRNPRLQQDRERKQKDDEERVTQMVSALADAFNYEYDGTEPGARGELIRLKFQPNPSFDPPSRELRVYQGMMGHMWIDPATHHMVRLQAELFRDVDFGWGILGRLYKGGHFEIEQAPVAEGRWETTRTALDFSGKELMFKTLRIKDVETLSDFRPVSRGLSLAQGIELLHNYEPGKDVVAQQQPSPPTHAQK